MRIPEWSSALGKRIEWPHIFLVTALGATVLGAVFSTGTLFSIDKKIADAKEAARPASVTITIITAPSCADCFPLESGLNALKQQNLSIVQEQSIPFDAPEAQTLIKKLEIKRIPTYIVTGEISKPSLKNFVDTNGEIKGDTFVYRNVNPIFIDPDTKQKSGYVTVTYLTDALCTQCTKLDSIIASLQKFGVKISSTSQVAWNSPGGQKLINQYSLTQVPAVVLSSDAGSYDRIKSLWPQIGTVEADGVYVTRKLQPPYRDIQKNTIVGIVRVIYLEESACKDCYNAQQVHQQVLTQRFGIGIGAAQSIDSQSPAGKALIEKYTIARVPTVLISPEAAAYATLTSQWSQVGTIEKDGWYVFRTMEAIGSTYKDLRTGTIVTPQAQSTTPPAS